MKDIENKAMSYDNLIAYVEKKAIELDNLSTLTFKDWQETNKKVYESLSRQYEILFHEYEATKRAYLDILDQTNPPFYHYVEFGRIKNFEDGC